MNERSLPEEGRITDKLPETIAPLPPNTRIAIAPAAGRPSLPVATPGREEWPLPYEITWGGLRAVGAAFLISLCLFGYGAGNVMAVLNPIPGSEPMADLGCLHVLAVLAGGPLMGGALGAAIGHVFRDEKGGAALMGAFIGALAGPPIVLFLLLAYGFVFGGGMSV
jgi:hypothetical protein